MGRKIFISYKYADSDVKQFSNLGYPFRKEDTAKSYVSLLKEYLEKRSDHVDKSEPIGEDLSLLKEPTIEDKLYNLIYDSTMTIVMISRKMNTGQAQKDQWIPREISYSLREQPRKNINGKSIISGRNAILAIVLPDRAGSYSYFIDTCALCKKRCTIYNIQWLFEILRENTFNHKEPNLEICNSRFTKIYHDDPSYITYVKWEDFVGKEEAYIEKAYEIQAKKDEYKIQVDL